MDEDLRAAIGTDLRRVTERLRTAPLARVEAACAPARVAVQDLADLAVGSTARDAAEPPTWRDVPMLGDEVLGDQVAVLGADLVDAVRGVEDDAPVWTRDGRRPLGTELVGLATTLRALRAAL